MKELEKEQSFDCNELNESIIALYIRRALVELSCSCSGKLVNALNEGHIDYAQTLAKELKDLTQITCIVEDVLREISPTQVGRISVVQDTLRGAKEWINQYVTIWNDVCARGVEIIAHCCKILEIKDPKFIPPEFIEYFKEHPSEYDWAQTTD